MEITSTEKTNGGFAAKRTVILMVKKIRTGVDNRWLIDEVIAGSYEPPQSELVKPAFKGISCL